MTKLQGHGRRVMKRLIVLLTLLFLALPSGLRAAPEAQEYQGQISSPSSNAVVRGQVTVAGTANHPDFWKYEIRVAPGQNPSIGDAQWYRVVVREQAVVNGQLAVWDTSVLPDGVYTLRLRVVRRDGNWMDFDVLPLTVRNTAPPTATPLPPTATIPPPTATTEPSPTAPLPSNTPAPTSTVESSVTPAAPATLTPASTSSSVTLATLTPQSVEEQPTTEASPTNTPIVIDAPTIIVAEAATSTAEEEAEEPEIALGEAGATPPAPPAEEPLIPAIPDTFGGGLEMGTLASACLTGAAFTAGLFLLIGFLYLLRSLVGIFR